MSDLRDELAEVIGKTSVANDGPDWGWLSGADSRCLADAILPIIERETTRARAEVASLIRAHQDAEAAYWAMAEDADDETAKRLAADVTRTYEALLASVEGES